jgi:hypothetical protein
MGVLRAWFETAQGRLLTMRAAALSTPIPQISKPGIFNSKDFATVHCGMANLSGRHAILLRRNELG